MVTFAFLVLSLLAIASAVVVVTHRNAVISALALAANLVSIAGFYLLLNAQYLALLQVIVYAGAIMVLILFVIMLLNLPDEARTRTTGIFQNGLSIALAAVLALILGWTMIRSDTGEFGATSEGFGTVRALGQDLFTRFVYPFEAISLLLIVAMIGAVLLAKRRL